MMMESSINSATILPPYEEEFEPVDNLQWSPETANSIYLFWIHLLQASKTFRMIPQVIRRYYPAIIAIIMCIGITMASDLAEDQVLSPEDLRMLHYAADKRSPNDDLTKILLKKMRFRDTEPMLNTLRQYHAMPKSKRQEMLMNNLAALLSGLKQRQAESNLRIPTLRFG
ncbi:hypothetical protein LOTGIDRAFT_238636 [Lottia gigantea]|uniref:Uncharacterized protein n=1 Tax=Lottia gigantea TaxID=225164 RepID=V4B1Q3_LOTGI|nr:hypothetical protein LOTGIDRAFT_238636 [Lottia gigantea]ESP00257.1 hypothetical protein LOTGIDRAFT_238636 [Lottia gigantea]